ncbi:hypothetical protein [Micrococcus lylae]|uniref:hypothetical protein n=1 Tax=Micrococcus lylae TaxID=1273 RepID=UPI000C80ACD3|nr:hypothetical protein [Micrococcus lylae]WIK82899.1 hypothetical protein CJ228_003610 [Micrococcus lylae]
MTEYDFETYPTDPDSMSEYLQEREAAGNPMTREEGEAYIAWNTAKEQKMGERIARMAPEEEHGKGGIDGLDEAMSARFDLEDARFEVQALVETAEDAERAAGGKRPIKRERDIVASEGFSGMGVTPRGW